jgi:hypothetical protein
MHFAGVSKFFASRKCVEQQWAARLPAHKLQVFDRALRLWTPPFNMLSVALDEAISLRSDGRLVLAQQQAAISSQVMAPLTLTLITTLARIYAEARHMPDLPVVDALNPSFFRGPTAQDAAGWNNLFFHILFGSRARFFLKVRILSEMLEKIAQEFCTSADEIAAGACAWPDRAWFALECLHYDFNTCLRESEVLLKCFLGALPASQLPQFEQTLLIPVPAAVSPQPRLVSDRRMN